jgi:putative transposase
VLQVAEEYRHRFGIESSYRIMHQTRAKTTSRDPARRLLLVAIAFLVVNLWVWCQWQMLLITRQRCRRAVIFTLDTFRHFVARHIEHIYGIVTHLKL